MKIDPDEFRVKEGDTVALRHWPTKVKPVYASKEHYRELLAEHVAQLSALQELLYASDRYAILLIFQAMDAAGKDGAIQHVMSGVNPQGCQVFSFKHPSSDELQHDFLWRIVQLERHLHRNGTRIVKFYLHLSKNEQRKRLLARIDDPTKNWKFSEADLAERKFWKRYMEAYGDCLGATSTDEAPWYVIPADDKENARLIVSQIVVDTLDGLKMSYPEVSAARRRELRSIRRRLAT